MAKHKQQDPECLTYSVPKAGALLGLGQAASYKAAERGDIPIIQIGRLKRVPKLALHQMLEKAGK
jgi:excisionase family DNA binding protein